MGRDGHYRAGEYLVSCEICGRNRYSSEMRRNWKRQMVCADTCYELRHPQDRVKVRPDIARPEDARPDANYTHSAEPAGTITADDLTEYDGDEL